MEFTLDSLACAGSGIGNDSIHSVGYAADSWIGFAAQNFANAGLEIVVWFTISDGGGLGDDLGP
jgi:hypothetical protein